MKKSMTVRNGSIGACLGYAAFLFMSAPQWMFCQPLPKTFRVYVGTYTSGESNGIYVFGMEPATGVLHPMAMAAEAVNPSYMAFDPAHRYLYAVNEVKEFEGKPGGSVSAFSVDPQTGGLRLLNQQPTHGGSPCYVAVDAKSRFVLTANYGGGSLSVHPILPGGKLGPSTDFVQHYGSGPNKQRQEAPHTHSIVLDPANRYAFAPDLGLDKIMAYRFDAERGKLKPNDPPWAGVEAGAGPRHFAFHPDGKHAYVINELNSTIGAFRYDAAKGALEWIETVKTIPGGFTGSNSCADVHVAPSGKYVYGSNRGHNSIARFKIDLDTGKLTALGHVPTQGRTPRNFAIDPTGTFLLAANQNTNTVVVFRIDQTSGELLATGNGVQVPSPVCIQMVPVFK